MGVKLRLVQYPCKSGLPSGVRGTVEAFVLAAVAALALDAFTSAFLCSLDDCAPRNPGVNKTIANAIPRPAGEKRTRRCTWPPRRLVLRLVISSSNEGLLPAELQNSSSTSSQQTRYRAMPHGRETRQKSRIVPPSSQLSASSALPTF